jgi:predicted DCC family thiol-disulfide oxidoreductase YuxK
MKEKSIIWFDDECLLCNRSVQFILQHDPKAYFKFGCLRQLSSSNQQNPESILLQEGEIFYNRSTAVFKIIRKLEGPIKYLYFLVLIPRPIRDFFYRIIAKNRKRWFGSVAHCNLMEGRYSVRFIQISS